MHIQQTPFELTLGKRGAIRISNTTGQARARPDDIRFAS